MRAVLKGLFSFKPFDKQKTKLFSAPIIRKRATETPTSIRSDTDREMGYVLRVRLASFFAGAATASAVGFYILHRDYKVAHAAISQQVKELSESLDGRISALEKLKEVEAPRHVEATE
ncbi:PREDICTED: uncharacterized protein LOC104593632 [Nelumbo nucifera]|uniref:Uncharacterized protein LOC104593632 n=1 Tax=Nelumbo nucifera TaxID=4432 RepID=A0A1U7ZE29_NELNU|nr:PREDICTED: uncharacterized protein LOC104593632 [Nelumbo nucifera]